MVYSTWKNVNIIYSDYVWLLDKNYLMGCFKCYLCWVHVLHTHKSFWLHWNQHVYSGHLKYNWRTFDIANDICELPPYFWPNCLQIDYLSSASLVVWLLEKLNGKNSGWSSNIVQYTAGGQLTVRGQLYWLIRLKLSGTNSLYRGIFLEKLRIKETSQLRTKNFGPHRSTFFTS